jgi:hypothetical protein
MKDRVDDRMVRKVISRCNVYPKQEFTYIKEHIKKVALLTDKELNTSPSRKRLIRKTSKAMDLKSKIENDDWIKFEQDTIDLEDFR